MPAYGTQPVAALYPGTPITLVNNAATDSGVTTTQQFAVGPSGDFTGCTIMIANTTNQQAQGQWSWTDVTGDYQNLSGCIIPAGSVLAYNLAGGFMRFTMTAPTSGSLVVAR